MIITVTYSVDLIVYYYRSIDYIIIWHLGLMYTFTFPG